MLAEQPDVPAGAVSDTAMMPASSPDPDTGPEEGDNGNGHRQTEEDEQEVKPMLLPPAAATPTAAAASKPRTTVPVYPRPLYSHEIVTKDPSLFLEALHKFHDALGTSLARMPVIAGKELDLFLLFKEVTARGGFEKVIRDKTWKDVMKPFEFPPTQTSASFILRKYYVKLLWDFEQVYYFHNQGAPVPPPEIALRETPGRSTGPRILTAATSGEPKQRRKRKKMMHESQAIIDPAKVVGEKVIGSVDSKFEYGYFVTVNIQGKTFKGILYHSPEAKGMPTVPPLYLPSMAISVATAAMSGQDDDKPRKRRGRKRRDEALRKDPNAPKPPRTGFNFYSMRVGRPRAREMHPDVGERELPKFIGELWNSTSTEERQPYLEMAAADKERYERELREYREQHGGVLPDVDTLPADNNDHQDNLTSNNTEPGPATVAETSNHHAAGMEAGPSEPHYQLP
eukprot:jgi/Chlat1/6076/Chrsp4S06217